MNDMPKAKNAAPYGMPAKKSLRYRILLAAVIFIVYFFLKYTGSYLSTSNSNYPLISISLGFGIAMVLVLGYDYIAVIGLAAIVYNLYHTGNPSLSISLAACSVIGITLSAYLANKFADGAHAFDSMKNTFKFVILAGCTSVSVISVMETFVHWLYFPTTYNVLLYFTSAWFSYLASVLLVTIPTLLYLNLKSNKNKKASQVEFTLIVIFTIILGLLVFGPINTPLLLNLEQDPYLCLLPVVWTASRTTRKRTQYIVLLIATIAIVGTLLGYSPILTQFDVNLGLQTFLIFMPIVGLTISVISFERDNAMDGLVLERNLLSRRVNEKAKELLKISENEAKAKVISEHKAWKKLDKVKSIFLSVTGHELRTPITPIIGQLELLQRGYLGRLSKKQKESIGMALRNAHKLDKLTRDFLELTRIQSSILKFDYTKINLKSYINNLVKEEDNYLPQKRIRIITRVGELPKISMDPDKITRVLKNLLDNAKKFSPEKSTITVTVKRQDRMLFFSVTDLGIGISAEDKKKVLTPFFQADESKNRSYGGVGLGLAICKGIVESWGGKIWFESVQGEGTTFYFTAPLKPLKRARRVNLFSSR